MKPKIYFFEDHGINPNLIDPDALFIVKKLRDAGFTAYIVGGCVRDILASEKPKDFDISTSALPEQIKNIFRKNCLLIGRRFRLAHIRFGRKVFEVSTFRSGKIDEEELILRDNEWGTPEEDAIRRDFSINGLFYDPYHQTVIDYVNGWEDLKQGIIRSIGNADNRFKQDPVRMIRLLKFQARFGWEIDPECLRALENCRDEIIKSSPARVLEELLRMLESGHAHDFIDLLSKHDLLNLLIPELDNFLKGPHGGEVFKYLETLDEIHRRNPDIKLHRPLALACLLFPIIEDNIDKQYLQKGKPPNLGQLTVLISSCFRETMTSSFTHFPKKLSSQASYIIATQYRLTPIVKKKKQRFKFLYDKDFHFALKFLKIRALVDSTLADAYYNWEKMHRKTKHSSPRKKTPAKNIRKKKKTGRSR